MLVPVSGIYIALLALVGLALQQHVGIRRLHADVSLGDGGDEGLTVAMRRQANFVEQVPIALLIVVALELNGASALWLHCVGVALLVARIVHPFGLEMANSKRIPRFIGAAGTLVIMLVATGKLLSQVL